ncbi:MAG: hypothetical protein ACLR56_11030 [Oscillospiraceae bacterium]
MSATVAAALKRIAVAVFTDKKSRKTLIGLILGIIVIIAMPIAVFISALNMSADMDSEDLKRFASEKLTDEEKAELQTVEDTMKAIETAKTRGLRQRKQRKRRRIYLFLYEQSGMKVLRKSCPTALQRIRPTSSLLPLLIPHSERSLKRRITEKF